MKHPTILRNGALIIAASLLTLAACKRNSASDSTPALTNADDNGGYASDAATLENTSNDVISMVDVAASTGNASALRTTSACATVTNDTSITPHILTINFGSTNCLCVDGKYRKGEIIVSYSGAYKTIGSAHTITYSGYYVNNNYVTGSKTVTNEGLNSSGQDWYAVALNDSITLASTDSVISWTASRTRTWLAGYDSTTRIYDSFAIADNGSTPTVLTRANGHQFTLTISSPLIVAYDCAYIESGILIISSPTFTSGGDRTLNYGYGLGSTSGLCDDLAQLTIGSHTYVVTLSGH